MMRSILFATLLATAAVPANATALVIDGGWQSDIVNALVTPSDNSPWTFTLTDRAYFRVTDAFLVGDIYTVTDPGNSILAQTAFATDGATVASFNGVAWTNLSYSRLSLLLGEGSYSINIAGNCGGGCPAGFGVRLDTFVADVPEPESWALMVVGFGMVGVTMRRRVRTVVA